MHAKTRRFQKTDRRKLPSEPGEIEGYAKGYKKITRNLLLVHNDSVSPHPGIGRSLTPDWADLDMLKRWKAHCLSAHGAKCEKPLRIWPTRPAYLIDVDNKCLVSGQVSGGFVALSYRYGRITGAAIDAVTLERLQEPYALGAMEFQRYLSPIVRHAMYLTSVIGERYLWADAICIPQTDEAMRRKELTMMGAIYANAVVSIIAADGDAQDGLPGIEETSQPRKIDQCIIPFGDEKIIVRNIGITELHDGNENEKWSNRRDHYHGRGWTFQEYRMSKRKIFFRKGSCIGSANVVSGMKN